MRALQDARPAAARDLASIVSLTARRESRTEAVERMANDLVRFDSWRQEADAIRSLFGNGHSMIDRFAPRAIAPKDLTSVIIRRLDAEKAAFVARTADPFGVDNDCPNPQGHAFTAACGEVVCIHCAKTAWS